MGCAGMSDYAATFLDGTGTARLEGTLTFTDPDNQPVPGGGNPTLDSLTVAGNTHLNGDVTINGDTEIGANSLNLDSSAIGFFGATPVAQPTVANATAAAIIAALAELGLIIDGT